MNKKGKNSNNFFLNYFFNVPVKQALTQSFTFHDPHDLVIWFPKTQHDGSLGYKIWGVWFYKLQYLKGLLVICSGVSNQPIIQHIQKIINREKSTCTWAKINPIYNFIPGQYMYNYLNCQRHCNAYRKALNLQSRILFIMFSILHKLK